MATRQSTEIFADGLRAGGFTVSADVPPDDNERQRRESVCDFQFIISRIAPDYADPGAYLVMWEEGQAQNRCDIPFPKLWVQWDKQATSLDPAVRKAAVKEMEDILLNDEEEGLYAMFTHTLATLHLPAHDPLEPAQDSPWLGPLLGHLDGELVRKS